MTLMPQKVNVPPILATERRHKTRFSGEATLSLQPYGPAYERSVRTLPAPLYLTQSHLPNSKLAPKDPEASLSPTENLKPANKYYYRIP